MKLSPLFSRLVFIAAALQLAACSGPILVSADGQAGGASSPDLAEPQDSVMKFSAQSGQTGLPKGWQFYRLAPYKKNTVYRLENYQGRTVLSANAQSAASGLAVKLKPQSPKNAWLQWEWKAVGSIPTADNAERATDDAPLRILIAFDGNKSKLPLKDRLAFEMASLISGQEMPYATLMYIWAGKGAVDSIIPNANSARIKMVVVDAGWDGVGEWRKHQRDLSADFLAAYGETPGNLIGVGILTDTDNTHSEVKAFYGDIEIVRKSPKP